jgi:hypothetical protein
MNKDEQVLKIRLSDSMKKQFVKACEIADKEVDLSLRLRMLIREFIKKTSPRRLEMAVKIWRPNGYDKGAYRVKITIGKKEQQSYKNNPVPFRIPRLRCRMFIADKGYVKAVQLADRAELRGIFIDGVWDGHVYTNGIAEDQNPVSTDVVKASLEDSVEEALLPFMDF